MQGNKPAISGSGPYALIVQRRNERSEPVDLRPCVRINKDQDLAPAIDLANSYSQVVDINTIRDKVAALGIQDVQVQNFGTAKDILIRMPVQKGSTSGAQSERVMEALQGAGMDYQVVSTATPLDASLLGYLRARARR